jgi:hypothetical protein
MIEQPDWFAITRGPRGSGRTTVMADAAKKIRGYLVVRNHNERERVEREHGLPCVSIYESERMRGIGGPVLFDPDAVGLICADYDRAMYALQAELRKAKEDLTRALTALARKPRPTKPRRRKVSRGN